MQFEPSDVKRLFTDSPYKILPTNDFIIENKIKAKDLNYKPKIITWQSFLAFALPICLMLYWAANVWSNQNIASTILFAFVGAGLSYSYGMLVCAAIKMASNADKRVRELEQEISDLKLSLFASPVNSVVFDGFKRQTDDLFRELKTENEKLKEILKEIIKNTGSKYRSIDADWFNDHSA